LQKDTASDADGFLAFADVDATGNAAPRYMLASFSSNVRRKSIQRNASRYFSWTGAFGWAFFFLGRAVCSIERL
jgi:hypothetical protein